MRLGQNGKRSDVRFCLCEHTDAEPPVERQHPPHHVIVVELGKPNVFLCGWAAGVCELRSARGDSGYGIAEKANAWL
jgi:hypothetical protein